MTTLNVDLGERSYPIIIDSDALSSGVLSEWVSGKKVCIVTSQTIADLYLDKVAASIADSELSVVLLPEGEQFKTLETLQVVFDAALENKLNRSSLFIALGGGVTGDMTGFAAACYQRGIDFIQIPTTLLSQVDSSVGGKTGVNHPLGKNMIGAFHQPKGVLVDVATLDSLPDRELSAGMAEVIKYGLIYDVEFFSWLEKNMQKLVSRDEAALIYAISRSCEIKAAVVSEDETESGVRAILNFGHTFGHSIESNMGYGKWLHGEAVAVGMIMAVDLSARQGFIDEAWVGRSKDLIKLAGLPTEAPAALSVDQFLESMSVDKKNITGSIRLVLLERVGKAIISDSYDSELMKQVIADNTQVA